MLRFLYTCPDVEVLSKDCRLIYSAKLVDCDPTYLYALYELLEAKGVSFDEFAEDSELHIVNLLSEVVFSITVQQESQSDSYLKSSDSANVENPRQRAPTTGPSFTNSV